MIAGVYSVGDYAIALWVLVPFVLWLLIEMLGILKATSGFMARMSSRAPASAQEAAQRVTEQPYASARNAKQGRN